MGPGPLATGGFSGTCAQSEVNTSPMSPMGNCGNVVLGMYRSCGGTPNARSTSTSPSCATSTVAPPRRGASYFLNSEVMNSLLTGDLSEARLTTCRVYKLYESPGCSIR